MQIDPQLDAHVEAFLAHLLADPELVDVIHEGNVENRPERYASVYHDNGRHVGERHDRLPIQSEYRFRVHSVGADPAQVRWVASRIIRRALGARLIIPGRKCWPVRHSALEPAKPDPAINPPVWFAVDEFRLRSTLSRRTEP